MNFFRAIYPFAGCVVCATAGAAPGAGASLAAGARATAGDTLRVTVVVDDSATRRALLRGIAVGTDEASHTGGLFGTVVAMRLVTAGAGGQTVAPLGVEPALVVAAGDSAACAVAAHIASSARAPAIDVGCPPAAANAAGMYSLVAGPGAPPDDSTRIELWSGTLERFGAAQLNERFRRRTGTRMDSPAWAGWLAMKIALELSMRARSTKGGALARQLADSRTQFDGQKGRPLRFDARTRQLVQPRYRVAGSGDGERVVAEVVP